MKDNRKEEVVSLLRSVKVSPSMPRVAIFSYVLQHPVHPTVEMIYDALSPEYSTLSKTTIYNTLKLLASKGLIQVLNIDDRELRFDATVMFHGHFKCRRCGRIMDVPGVACPPFPDGPGMYVESAQVFFYGLCESCRMQDNSGKPFDENENAD